MKSKNKFTYLVVLVLFIALVIQPALALKITESATETEWGNTSAHWARFGYFVDDEINITPYWYKDFIYKNISEISIKEDYNEVNITYKTLINETQSWIEISRNIKEYRYKPFTEITVTTRSDDELAIAFPNFVTIEEGKFFLAPGVAEPIITEIGDETDGTWPHVIHPEHAANLEDNYALICTPGEKSTLLITNKKFYGITSLDTGDYWNTYFAMWAFGNLQPDENYTYKYWLTPIYISENDTVGIVKAKASELAHEALVKPIKIYEDKTRGYDYWLYEVWYEFEYENNEWNINPFAYNPHTTRGEIVIDTCLAAIYLPKNAISVKGKEGYPAVFSSGEPAIGLYFKDSINGAKGKGDDLWFGDESAGGGFYLKKFDHTKEIVKVYYAVPTEAKLIESYPVKIPAADITEKTKLIIADESYLKFSEMVFYISLVLLTITLIALLLVTKKGLLATIPLYLASLYFLYYFYLNPLRIHNFTLAIFLSSSLISSALTYKTRTPIKFYLSLLSASTIFIAILALFVFKNYLTLFLLVIPAIAISYEGWKDVGEVHE